MAVIPSVRPAHSAMGEQLADGPLRRGGGDGETQPLGQGDDGRVDAHHPAPRVQQRAAGAARIQRGGVLDDVLDEPAAFAPHGPAQGTDDAGGNRRLEPEGIAHGDHQLARLQAIRVAQFGPRQVAGGQADQGQVAGRVVADKVRVEGVAFRRDGAKPAAAVDHVAVGQGVAVGGQDEARARAAAILAPRPEDGNHRGSDLAHHRNHGPRIGVQQIGVGLGRRRRRRGDLRGGPPPTGSSIQRSARSEGFIISAEKIVSRRAGVTGDTTHRQARRVDAEELATARLGATGFASASGRKISRRGAETRRKGEEMDEAFFHPSSFILHP